MILRSLAILLGVSTIFIGSMATAQNIPIELSRIENRSLAEDKEIFFPQISENRGLDYSDNVVGRLSQESSEFDFLGEDIIVKTDSMGEDATDEIFETPMTGDRSDEVQVLFQITEW